MDNKMMLNVYKTSLLARRFEARIIQMAMAGELPGSLHAGAGQEVCQIAAISALRKDDYVLYGHRGVAYMIARGTNLSRFWQTWPARKVQRVTARAASCTWWIFRMACSVRAGRLAVDLSFRLAWVWHCSV